MDGKQVGFGVLRGLFGSLEKRLIGALLLIVLSTSALQMISQDRALLLRSQGEKLREAAINAEQAEQLVKAVAQFRLIARRQLEAGQTNDLDASLDELTDSAVQIDKQINALRIGGMDLYDLPEDMTVFKDIDRHIEAIAAAPRFATPQTKAALELRNGQLATAAGAIRASAGAERETAIEALRRSTDDWHMLVSVTGVLTVLVVAAILFDLISNIVPALRRMHGALRRLAAGDLDFEIETFRLQELNALSGALETFRLNARAVKNLAYTDPSTGMLNRRAFMEGAGAQLAAGSPDAAEGFIVAVVDVDRFKHINDDYGHAAGDRLVRLIGERMAAVLAPEAIVARIGGDEFAISAPLLGGRSAAAVASDLMAAMQKPFDVGDFDVAVTVSIGSMKVTRETDADIGSLLNKADLALYASKNNGRNQATLFTHELEEERELDRALERDLARAFGGGELRMVYQPIHPVDSGEREVEALVRWRHPTMGEISPARFIPAAERSGLMVRLGDWIVGQALGDLSRWPDLTMSINLSPLQLQQDGFAGYLLDCCRRNRITPARLILEVTESVSIERNARALLTLTLLRSAGFRIALDDFGTGYSSLCMMKTFKFDRLKLDRSLISDLANDATSAAVFDAAVTMGLRIGAEVVAEGISEPSLEEPVRNAGCTHMQGFLYSRPIEADAVEGYYRALAASPARAA